ncbi:hypothetical protein WA026_010020 [Henosepilachna vigintioctopunctata]|uniref:Ig-like domain-containing protein n=1 Tax=Henosepilachna vigintioctopunctata TaxID=420089 RepID=A0AAW1TLN8_9CUCU
MYPADVNSSSDIVYDFKDFFPLFSSDILLFYINFFFTDGCCLRLDELRVPTHAVRDQTITLECYFDLEGETLYSVKWYKDGHEFYRFVPRDVPQTEVFSLPGVTVELDYFILWILIHYDSDDTLATSDVLIKWVNMKDKIN